MLVVCLHARLTFASDFCRRQVQADRRETSQVSMVV